MIIIEEVLVSNSLLQQEFACDIPSCKGSCCWEGDLGAPIEESELSILKEEYPKVKPYLDEESQTIIESGGTHMEIGGSDPYCTPLKADGRCAYMIGQIGQVAVCAWEKAYNDGATSFRKPISCHLYPIRISRSPQNQMDVLVYDDWSICSAARVKGEKDKIHVLTFLREPLIKKYGEEFYERLQTCLKGYLDNK